MSYLQQGSSYLISLGDGTFRFSPTGSVANYATVGYYPISPDGTVNVDAGPDTNGICKRPYTLRVWAPGDPTGSVKFLTQQSYKSSDLFQSVSAQAYTRVVPFTPLGYPIVVGGTFGAEFNKTSAVYRITGSPYFGNVGYLNGIFTMGTVVGSCLKCGCRGPNGEDGGICDTESGLCMASNLCMCPYAPSSFNASAFYTIVILILIFLILGWVVWWSWKNYQFNKRMTEMKGCNSKEVREALKCAENILAKRSEEKCKSAEVRKALECAKEILNRKGTIAVEPCKSAPKPKGPRRFTSTGDSTTEVF